MKFWFYLVAAVCGIIIITAVITLPTRWLNSVTNMTEVITPAPHIECVVVTSTDGVAIDCNWEEK